MKNATIVVNLDTINAIAHSRKANVALAVVSAITQSNAEGLLRRDRWGNKQH